MQNPTSMVVTNSPKYQVVRIDCPVEIGLIQVCEQSSVSLLCIPVTDEANTRARWVITKRTMKSKYKVWSLRTIRKKFLTGTSLQTQRRSWHLYGLEEKHKKPLNVINQRIKRFVKEEDQSGANGRASRYERRTYSDKESLTQMSGFFDRELLEIADILDLSIGALMMGESAEQSLRSIQTVLAAQDSMQAALTDLREKVYKYDQ